MSKKVIHICCLILCWLVGTYDVSAQFNTTYTTFDSLKSAVPKMKDDTTKVLRLIEMGQIIYLKDSKASIGYCEQAIILNKKLKWDKGYALIYLIIARTYLNADDYNNSLLFFKKSLFYGQKLKDRSIIAKTYLTLSEVYRKTAQLPKAMEYVLKGESIAKEINNHELMGMAYNGFVLINYALKDYNKALYYGKKSVELAKKYNTGRLANDLANLGSIYVLNNIMDTGLNCILQSTTEYKKQQKYELLPLQYANTASVKNLLKEYNQGLVYIDSSLLFIHKFNLIREESFSYLVKAELLKNKGENFKSIIALKKSYQIADKIGFDERKRDVLNLLHEIYDTLHQYDKAYFALKEYNKLSDSISKIENKKDVTRKEMQFKFDLEQSKAKIEQDKKDALIKKEIENGIFQRNAFIIGGVLLFLISLLLLNRYRAERNSKQIIALEKQKTEEKSLQLEQTNAVKDKLFSIISHDLRSPLISLDATMKLIQKGGLSQEQFAKYQASIGASLSTTINMLDNLLLWSLANINGLTANLQKTNISTLIKEQIDLVQSTATLKNITIILDIPNNVYAYTDENIFRLVCRNLLTNALKFTNKDGLIELSIKQTQDNIILSVKDNGIGISNDDLKKIFTFGSEKSKVGTNKEKGTGLGLFLCYELIKKVGGKLIVESELGKGSTFFLTLHVYNKVDA